MWKKFFSNREPIMGQPGVSWSRTQLNNINRVDLFINGETIECDWGVGEYHYEEDWIVQIGTQEHKLLCVRLTWENFFNKKKRLIEVDSSGTISKLI
jgi:hypothetical protein